MSITREIYPGYTRRMSHLINIGWVWRDIKAARYLEERYGELPDRDSLDYWKRTLDAHDPPIPARAVMFRRARQQIDRWEQMIRLPQ